MTRAAPKHNPMRPLARVHTPSPTQQPGSSWRAGKTTAERGYGGRWQRARQTFLSRPDNVLCRMCSEQGLIQPATVVDHIKPHRGDQALFWDTANWQPLCKRCHDGRKQAQDKGGQGARRIGMDGLPVDGPGGRSETSKASPP